MLRTIVGEVQIADDILIVRLKEDDELSAEKVLLHKQQIHSVTGDRKMGILLDAREVSLLKIPTEVIREEAGENAYSHLQTGLAILSNSKLLQQMIQRYIFMHKPLTPTRLFSNEEQAVTWLKKLNNQYQ